MSDTPNDQAAGAAGNAETAQQQAAPLVFSGQYIKDLSFEAPNAPEIFTRLSKAPDIPIQIDVQARRLQDNWFEVVLHFNVEGKAGDEKAFILELAYGAVVQINAQEPEHTQPLLLIEAPRTMFPFARNIIADITRDGGFPPLMLQPIDFVALYRQRLQQAAAQGEQQDDEGQKAS
jgi:preprotein translocase subunit SecB